MPDHPADPAPAPPPSSSPRFTGRVAVITGGGRGMGRAHALGLAREGCDVVICDICEDLPDGTPYPKTTSADLEAAAELVRAEGRRCIAIKADVSDPDAAADVIDRAMTEFGRLDFLVANAALTLEGPIVELTAATFETVLRHNVLGVFNVLAPALRIMQRENRGRVAIIGSGAGRKGEPEAAPYVASKWALIGLTKTAALEAAKSGVGVNCILPGPVDTPMMASEQRIRESVPDKNNPTREDLIEASKDATPMGYAWVKSEDVTAAVVFLLSDEARFISGDTLSIDAGDVANWT